MKMIKPYEDDESYIFAAFASEDERRVSGIIEQLCGFGVRVWFDGESDTRNDSNKIIDSNLNNSKAVLIFVSQNIIGSHDFRRQINSAVLEKKPLIAVYLEKTQLTVSLKLQLSSAQSVFMWETNGNELFDFLLKCDNIKECMGKTDEKRSKNSGFVLVRKRTGEKINLPGGGLRVGRRRSLCDYTVDGNKTLSRIHATFTVSDNRCRVTDNNSLNGVYINGVRLEENGCAELKVNDEIRLGSERFILTEEI